MGEPGGLTSPSAHLPCSAAPSPLAGLCSLSPVPNRAAAAPGVPSPQMPGPMQGSSHSWGLLPEPVRPWMLPDQKVPDKRGLTCSPFVIILTLTWLRQGSTLCFSSSLRNVSHLINYVKNWKSTIQNCFYIAYKLHRFHWYLNQAIPVLTKDRSLLFIATSLCYRTVLCCWLWLIVIWDTSFPYIFAI